MNNSKKQLKKIPKFKNEDEEREFWAVQDSTDYVDWSQAIVNPVFPNLKQSSKSISLRLPITLLDSLKALANRRDIPYQSYIKVILDEKVRQELRFS